jgi:branched-chain amino acid transport system ATP-binding protein
MKDTVLKISKLHTHYGKVEALHGVDITIREGEIVTLIGANGAGKTTLLMTLSGVQKVTSGRIQYRGMDIENLAPHEVVRLGIAHSPEGRRIFPKMTVLENLQMGTVVNEGDFLSSDLTRMFQLFPRLDERRHQLGGTLSGGEQQMLAIARALMARPRLLLLDEPSLGLAPLIVKQIFSVIKDINKTQNMTILLVEQNAHHALRLAHRGYVMVNGRITLSGTGEELLTNPDVQAAYLEGAH